ncbi:MAG: UbiA family prenyltransferase, partial [Candidatus Methanomethylophilaceae archaeon]
MNRFVQLSRPVVVIMGVLFLFAAALIAAGDGISDHLRGLLIAVPAVIAFVIGGNSINNYSDRETDRISHPNRPIPSGRIEPQTALRIGIVSLTVSAVFSFMLPNLTATCIVLAACAFIVIYELYLKKIGFLGNIT